MLGGDGIHNLPHPNLMVSNLKEVLFLTHQYLVTMHQQRENATSVIKLPILCQTVIMKEIVIFEQAIEGTSYKTTTPVALTKLPNEVNRVRIRFQKMYTKEVECFQTF